MNLFTDLTTSLWILGVVTVAMGLLIAVVVGTNPSRGRRRTRDDIEGQRLRSRAWACLDDVADLVVARRPRFWRRRGRVSDPRRIRLGFLDGAELANPSLRSVMVIAPSGAGKTPRVVVPTVLLHRGPAVVTSVKADVLALTRHHRQAEGPVWVFDPACSAGPTARWSPLSHVRTWGDALDAALWLQESSKAGSTGSGVTDAKFWDDNARHLLAPLVYLCARMGATMAVMADLVANSGEVLERRVREALTALTEHEHGASGSLGPAGYWASYCSLEQRTKATISTTAFGILEGWAHPLVAAAVDVTAADEAPDVLSIDRFLDVGGTLYLVAPASDQDKFKAVFETLINAVVMNVERRAHRNGGRPLDPPLLLAMDEAANIATPRKLDQIASKSAGEGIVVLSIWQDEGQLERIYGAPTARTITSNHYAKIYLPGIQDPTTLENLSRQIGTDQFTTTSTSRSRDSTTRSTATQDLAVAPASMLRQLPADEAIVIAGRYPPIRARLHGWFDDRDLRARVDPAVARAFDQLYRKDSRAR